MLVGVWALSKIIKLVPLFVRRPSDILMLPVSVIFGWLHGLIKLYAAMTLHVVSLVPCRFDVARDLEPQGRTASCQGSAADQYVE